jgi:hypothetical protein
MFSFVMMVSKNIAFVHVSIKFCFQVQIFAISLLLSFHLTERMCLFGHSKLSAVQISLIRSNSLVADRCIIYFARFFATFLSQLSKHVLEF